MRPHKEIVIAAGPDKLAEHFGFSIHTVRSWMQRDKIPPDLWPEFVNEGWSNLDELASGARPWKRGQPAADAA